MQTIHYAHSLTGEPVQKWERLEDHLSETATMAESFASCFAPGWGRLAGLWHDIGKYQEAFQRRILNDPSAHISGGVDHASVGALLAKEKRAYLAQFPIAGHHGGLPDNQKLVDRLEEKRALINDARRGGLPASVENEPIPKVPGWLRSGDAASISFCTRFVFSALVDADFLSTERFYAGGKERDLGTYPSLPDIKDRLEKYLVRIENASPTAVNRMRARVLADARKAASLGQGVFSLTVPTGGGKTLTGLLFAIEHAIAHGLRRVIVVVPFTSIIEQTAQAYREALGDCASAVLEHHSNVDPTKETPQNRLAAENWDAPLVVTTSVQFFESLYANKPSRCRKLHRIAKSVVIFDEAQTFNAGLLAPIRHGLEELTSHYGVTAVLSTATQPALLEGAREIVRDPEGEFAAVAGRCDIVMPASKAAVSWEELAEELRSYERVLAIVHRRDDAQTLAQLVGEDCLHLSARMCAAHRSEVLSKVKRRLAAGQNCRLVATQLVEAGVDIDFPEVYRAFAGADSMAQAAGRCNREGRGMGRLHLFFAPTQPPRGVLRTAAELTRVMWEEGVLDLKRAETFRKYFKQLYNKLEEDEKGIMPAERAMQFETVAHAFRMIDEVGEPVVAPFGLWQPLVADVRRNGVSRGRIRALQRFMVNLYPQEIRELEKLGAIEKIADTFWAALPGFKTYSDRWGFEWHGRDIRDPESLVA